MFVLYLLADNTCEYQILTRRLRLSSSARVGWLRACLSVLALSRSGWAFHNESWAQRLRRAPSRIYYCVNSGKSLHILIQPEEGWPSA